MDKVYRLRLWRFGHFQIEEFEVVSKTTKTIHIKVYNDPSDTSKGYASNRYNLRSQDYSFFDTLNDALAAAKTIVGRRIEYYEEQTKSLKVRLLEIKNEMSG